MTDQGNRCHICTGCGRCAPGGKREEQMKVVTASFLLPGRKEPEGSALRREEAGPGEGALRREEAGPGEGILRREEAGPGEGTLRREEAGPGEGTLRREEAGPEEELAIADLGTTTIAMEWYDGRGEKRGQYVCPNPQRVFGTDVISRIQAAENPLLLRQMQQLARQALEQGIACCRQQGGNPERLVIAGNTTMLYLLKGHDPAPLGRAPFHAAYLTQEKLEVGGVETVTLPGLSAFVGADIAAGMLACGMDRAKDVTLLVDLGTNGEMALGNRDKMICCGTAAGPAFEGGGDLWGADMIALTAKLLERGLTDETGLLAEPFFESGVLIGDMHITQERIRQLQTAKAAVCAGIRTLIAAYGLDGPEQIRQVWLAGGFGYFLNVEAAITLGLLPQGLAGRVTAVGNTALAGAWIYGNEPDAGERLNRLRAVAQVLNLAEQQGFESCFVEAMYLRRI